MKTTSYNQLKFVRNNIFFKLMKFFILHHFRMFSYGEFKAEDQEKMLAALNKKVELVYRSCIGDNEANIRYDVSSVYYLG